MTLNRFSWLKIRHRAVETNRLGSQCPIDPHSGIMPTEMGLLQFAIGVENQVISSGTAQYVYSVGDVVEIIT